MLEVSLITVVTKMNQYGLRERFDSSNRDPFAGVADFIRFEFLSRPSRTSPSWSAIGKLKRIRLK